MPARLAEIVRERRAGEDVIDTVSVLFADVDRDFEFVAVPVDVDAVAGEPGAREAITGGSRGLEGRERDRG